MNHIIRLLCTIIVAALAACGGGGGGGGTGPLPPSPVVYTKAVMSLSTHALVNSPSAPLQVMEIKITLPQGALIADINQAITKYDAIGQINSGTLMYSMVDNTVFMQVTGNPITFGTFADIQCSIPATTTPDSVAFTSLNSPYSQLSMSGFSAIQGGPVNLVPEIKVDMSVTFQQ